MTPLGFFGWWLSLWDLFAIAIVGLIFRKKIVAFVNSIINKFKKKQTTTVPTTPDFES